MKLNDFTQFFDNPKVSVFDRSKPASTPVRIGKFYPMKWELLNFGNSQKSTSGHKMRLAPLVAPSFTDLRLEEHAAVVPLRVIMENYENTFNYALNMDGASLPHFTCKQYHNILLALLRLGHPIHGSLMDYFGYPIYSDLYKLVVNSVTNSYYTSSFDKIPLMNTSADVFDATLLHENFFDEDMISYEGSVTYRDTVLSIDTFDSFRRPKFYPFFIWLANKLGQFESSSDFEALVSYLKANNISILDYAALQLGSTTSALTDSYLNYLFGCYLGLWISKVDFPEDVNYSSLPFRAYLRVYMDWLTNGNFFDRDVFLDIIYNFETNINLGASGVNNNGMSVFPNYEFLYPVNRLWDYDYYTSLLPTAKADNAIEIPANSTVLDLAKLTAIQKLVLRLSYSSRYRDVVWNIFKIKPSDARLQQSSILNERVHNVGIGETIQTSETTTSSVLGSFSGRGYSSGNNKGYHIFCEEPCIVFDFVSLTAKARYRDSLHPLCHVDDILDLPIPDMDVLGNTPVYADLISGNALDSNEVFGFGRQYQEWLYNYGTVHGEFRTSLDYWQLVRSFDSTPRLNDEFLRMDDREDFDSIFSVTDAPHAFLDMYYAAKVSRHVHRSVRIIV